MLFTYTFYSYHITLLGIIFLEHFCIWEINVWHIINARGSPNHRTIHVSSWHTRNNSLFDLVLYHTLLLLTCFNSNIHFACRRHNGKVRVNPTLSVLYLYKYSGEGMKIFIQGEIYSYAAKAYMQRSFIRVLQFRDASIKESKLIII